MRYVQSAQHDLSTAGDAAFLVLARCRFGMFSFTKQRHMCSYWCIYLVGNIWTRRQLHICYTAAAVLLADYNVLGVDIMDANAKFRLKQQKQSGRDAPGEGSGQNRQNRLLQSPQSGSTLALLPAVS